MKNFIIIWVIIFFMVCTGAYNIYSDVKAKDTNHSDAIEYSIGDMPSSMNFEFQLITMENVRKILTWSVIMIMTLVTLAMFRIRSFFSNDSIW